MDLSGLTFKGFVDKENSIVNGVESMNSIFEAIGTSPAIGLAKNSRERFEKQLEQSLKQSKEISRSITNVSKSVGNTHRGRL